MKKNIPSKKNVTYKTYQPKQNLTINQVKRQQSELMEPSPQDEKNLKKKWNSVHVVLHQASKKKKYFLTLVTINSVIIIMTIIMIIMAINIIIDSINLIHITCGKI